MMLSGIHISLFPCFSAFFSPSALNYYKICYGGSSYFRQGSFLVTQEIRQGNSAVPLILITQVGWTIISNSPFCLRRLQQVFAGVLPDFISRIFWNTGNLTVGHFRCREICRWLSADLSVGQAPPLVILMSTGTVDLPRGFYEVVIIDVTLLHKMLHFLLHFILSYESSVFLHLNTYFYIS